MGVPQPLNTLPIDIQPQEAVDAVFNTQLGYVEDRLRQGMSSLIECDKEMVSYLIHTLRSRLRMTGVGGVFQFRIVTGTPPEDEEGPTPPLFTMMLREIQNFIRDDVGKKIIVLPHLDLLTTTTRSSLSDVAKEVVALVYENPEAVFLGFKDPSFELPEAVARLFVAEQSFVGMPRENISKIILQREARKFGVDSFDCFQLYKYVSGITPIRFRQIMSSMQDRGDYDPNNPGLLKNIYRDIRRLTLGGELEVPNVDLHKDIGGYSYIKERIQEDILDLYNQKDDLSSAAEVKKVEELIPKGIIFEGPPGTGKTYLAKAIATALDATVIVVSGPELKSKWVGESEQNLRKTFARARENAPAIIIFDEIDSFATRRGTYTGSGVEHSMVNQLLTEMDGFRKEELVFIVATTNFVESLDPALLRPGRFELTLEIPYPNEEDREAIINIYKDKFSLDLTPEIIKYIVSKTGGYSNAQQKTRFSGDHLYAICRSIGREVIRKGPHQITEEEIDNIIDDSYSVRPPTDEERQLIAIHECGHAMTACLVENAPAPDKVSIQGLNESIPGYVQQEDWKGDHVRTRQELIDQICVCLGGRAAEEIIANTISSGASNDLEKASQMARVMVERLGMVGDDNLLVPVGKEDFSADRKVFVEREANKILSSAMAQTKTLIRDNQKLHKAFYDALMDKTVLNKEDLNKIATGLDYKIEKLGWHEQYTLDEKS